MVSICCILLVAFLCHSTLCTYLKKIRPQTCSHLLSVVELSEAVLQVNYCSKMCTMVLAEICHHHCLEDPGQQQIYCVSSVCLLSSQFYVIFYACVHHLISKSNTPICAEQIK